MAITLGKTLVELESLPEEELRIWEAFYIEQPFGLWRDDFRIGLVASTMANTVSKKAFKPLDFMPFYSSNTTDILEDFDDVIIIS